MAAEKEEWKIPQLTAENHDTWFRRNKVKLKGKKVFYVCEKNLDSALLLVLIRSLPKEFKTTIDTLNAQLNLTVEQKLKFLEEKEVRDQQDANEKALPAFRKTEKYVPPYRRRNHKNSPLSSDSESGAKFTVQCFLCDGAHGVRDCPRPAR
ncbi:hypothetical protein PtrV1_07777 [Pyrenophora tritici-repentis]|nr:hypothetical protein PtrV1_07777 [Pyrenophora tritici-repentis]KAF7448819.1 hypothetical protein A1F99_058680 [Pyrenophora tritici-repentis]